MSPKGPSLKPILWLLALFVVAVAGLAIWRSSLPPPKTEPERRLPLTFAETTAAAKVQLKIDPRLQPYPVMVDRLYDEGVEDLRAFERQAAEDQRRLAAKGLPVRAYQRTIDWTLTAETTRLGSLKQTWFDDTGGAHPNSGAKALLWDRLAKREVQPAELFKPGADQSRLDAVLCRAIQAAKSRRQGAVVDPRTWPCPKWADSEFVLASSAKHGKAGGLVFLFDPYSIGPFVEGEWAITVPQADFRSELAPDWTGEFAGQPAA
jgi:hypothetical protein